MTANAMAGDRHKAIEAGMNDHIPKPIDIESALRTIAHWFVTSRRKASTQPQGSLPEVAGIDIEAGLKAAAGKPDLLKRLWQRFVDSESDFEARYRAAVDGGDEETATRYAHTLKGVAGSIGALELQAAAAALNAAHSGENFAMVLEQLEPLIENLRSAVGQGSSAGPALESPDVLIARLRELLEDSDAQAVEVAEALREHPDRPPGLDTVLKHTGEYDFDAALERLNDAEMG